MIQSPRLQSVSRPFCITKIRMKIQILDLIKIALTRSKNLKLLYESPMQRLLFLEDEKPKKKNQNPNKSFYMDIYIYIF